MVIFNPESVDSRSEQEVLEDNLVIELVRMVEDLKNGSLILPQGFADIVTKLDQTISVSTQSGTIVDIKLPQEKKNIVLQKLKDLGYIK